MQEELPEDYRSPRKRLVRTSSLDELREQKRLSRTESKEIGCDARDQQLDDAFNGWLKESMLHHGHEILQTRENQNLRDHGEVMSVMAHKRRDTASTATDVELPQLGSRFDVGMEHDVGQMGNLPLSDCKAVVEDVFAATEHPYAMHWEEELNKAMLDVSPFLEKSHRQRFPSPHAVEMVPVSSTKLNQSARSDLAARLQSKRTKTHHTVEKKRQCPVRVSSSNSGGSKFHKKQQETASRKRLESTQTCGVLPDAMPDVAHTAFLQYPEWIPCAHGWHQMTRSSDAEPMGGPYKSVFCQSSRYKDTSCPTVHLGSKLRREGPRNACPSMTPLTRTNSNAVNQGPPFLHVKQEQDDSWTTEKHKSVKKTTSAGSNEAVGEFRARRLCQKHKRTKKDKDVRGIVGGVEPPLRARSAGTTSGEGSESKSTSTKKEYSSPSSRGNARQDRRTTFAHLVHAELVRTGKLKLAVGHDPNVIVNVKPEGSILYKGVEYHSISSFALAVIRERNPLRRSCDGWKDVKYEGQRLETLRERYLCG